MPGQINIFVFRMEFAKTRPTHMNKTVRKNLPEDGRGQEVGWWFLKGGGGQGMVGDLTKLC